MRLPKGTKATKSFKHPLEQVSLNYQPVTQLRFLGPTPRAAD